MKKTMTCLCMTFLLLFSSTSVIHAAPQKGAEITPETVVTKDNFYEVLDYLGISRSNFKKNQEFDKSKAVQAITVGELSEVINKNKSLPSTIKVNQVETNDFNVSNNVVSDPSIKSFAAVSLTPVVYDTIVTRNSFTDCGLFELRVSGTGLLRTADSSSGIIYTWLEPRSSNVFINDTDFGYTATIKSASSSVSIDSYGRLRVDFNCTVERFFVLQWGPLSLGTQAASGYTSWIN